MRCHLYSSDRNSIGERSSTGGKIGEFFLGNQEEGIFLALHVTGLGFTNFGEKLSTRLAEATHTSLTMNVDLILFRRGLKRGRPHLALYVGMGTKAISLFHPQPGQRKIFPIPSM